MVGKLSPKGVYERTEANRPKPRQYPAEIIELVRRLYSDEGLTVKEVQARLPRGYKAQRVIERHIPERRPAIKRDQRGSRNTSWKGDDIGYDGAHERVKSVKGSASLHRCVDCGERADEWSYNGSCERERRDELSGCAYSPSPDRYSPRCRSCHTSLDRTRNTRGQFAPRGGDAHVR